MDKNDDQGKTRVLLKISADRLRRVGHHCWTSKNLPRLKIHTQGMNLDEPRSEKKCTFGTLDDLEIRGSSASWSDEFEV